jgi:hypothetical protein
MSRRFGSKLSALLFAVATGACLNGPALAGEQKVTFLTPAGGTSALHAIPIADSPVMMSCVQTVQGYVGEGQATIIRSTTDALLDWTGFDYATAGSSTPLSRGFSSFNGTHIIYCDFGGLVDIQVGNATSIQVHNSNSIEMKVVIMFIY